MKQKVIFEKNLYIFLASQLKKKKIYILFPKFYTLGIKLLDFCYRQDAEKAQRLLTCELHSWSSQSCLSLAVAANHRALLAHPCSQVILADLWMGGLRTRKNTNIKVNLI